MKADPGLPNKAIPENICWREIAKDRRRDGLLVPDRTGGLTQVDQAASDERGTEATSGHVNIFCFDSLLVNPKIAFTERFVGFNLREERGKTLSFRPPQENRPHGGTPVAYGKCASGVLLVQDAVDRGRSVAGCGPNPFKVCGPIRDTLAWRVGMSCKSDIINGVRSSQENRIRPRHQRKYDLASSNTTWKGWHDYPGSHRPRGLEQLHHGEATDLSIRERVHQRAASRQVRHGPSGGGAGCHS